MIDVPTYRSFISQQNQPDEAHGILHIERVVQAAMELARGENADSEIVIPAAWLHDCVSLPKNHPERKNASALAARKAKEFLTRQEYPSAKITAVMHAIEAHSYSAGIQPETIEAKVVQDADRLDALGAIGIARCLAVGTELKRQLYDPDDPLCTERKPDDSTYTIDHFFVKLFKLPETMNTESAKQEAERRVHFMKEFLKNLSTEITGKEF